MALPLSGTLASVHRETAQQPSTPSSCNSDYFPIPHEFLTLRQKIFALLEPTERSDVPRSFMRMHQRWVRRLSLLTFTTIITSVVVLCLETLPKFHKNPPAVIFYAEMSCVVLFTVEIMTRFIVCPSARQFLLSPLNVIDIVSVIPFYLELLLNVVVETDTNISFMGVLRALRLARVLRVLKLGRHSVGLQVVAAAMRQSFDAINLLVFLLVMAMLLFSTAIFFVEQQAATFDVTTRTWLLTATGKPSSFQSILHSFWWCIVSVTTCGYGDAVPDTVLGKIIASASLLTGLLVIAFPTILIGANFSDVHFRHQMKKYAAGKRRKYNELLKKSAEAGTPAPKPCLDFVFDSSLRRKGASSSVVAASLTSKKRRSTVSTPRSGKLTDYGGQLSTKSIFIDDNYEEPDVFQQLKYFVSDAQKASTKVNTFVATAHTSCQNLEDVLTTIMEWDRAKGRVQGLSIATTTTSGTADYSAVSSTTTHAASDEPLKENAQLEPCSTMDPLGPSAPQQPLSPLLVQTELPGEVT